MIRRAVQRCGNGCGPLAARPFGPRLIPCRTYRPRPRLSDVAFHPKWRDALDSFHCLGMITLVNREMLMRFAVALLVGMLAVMPANAATYLAKMRGTITSQWSSFDDPHLKVGDHVFLTATLTDDDLYAPWYFDPGQYAHASNLTITAGGLHWYGGDDILDGPWLVYGKGKILDLLTDLIPGDTDRAPGLISGNLNGHAAIYDARDYYGNQYETPGFTITWNLKGSSFRKLGAVPEPASWALMLAGFGVTGAALRRRRLPSIQIA